MWTNCWSRTRQTGFRFAVVFALLSQGLVPATAWNEVRTNRPQGAFGRHELVPDPVVYAAAKAAANRAAGHGPPVHPTGAAGLLPRIVTSFEGAFDPATL